VTESHYHHGNLRAELLAHALRRVREHGPGALVLRDLAKDAGVSPAAAYRHFDTIDHLRAEVARLARQELAAAMLSARNRTSRGRNASLRRFEAIGRAYVRFAVDEPGWFETAFAKGTVLPTTPEDPAAWDVLVGALNEMVADGTMPARYRESAPLVAWASVHGLGALLSSTTQRPDGTPVDAAIDDVVAGVVRALGISR
jgi:AcrR family transcriptional regulator